MSLHCGVWAGALGKGDLSAPGTEPASRVGLGCLEDCVDAGRGSWWSAGGQAQVRENLGNHCATGYETGFVVDSVLFACVSQTVVCERRLPISGSIATLPLVFLS